MGLFFNSYNKPGAGVSDEVEELSGFAKYFVIYKRHFDKLLKLNLTFLLPFLVSAILMFLLYFAPVSRLTYMGVDLWLMYVMPLPLVFMFPLWGGLMVVARRISLGQYVFVWHEFWKGVKENFKQFMFNGITVYILYVLQSFALMFYNSRLSDGFINYIPFVLVVLLALLFITAQYYIPLLIVSVNLPLVTIYKNALLFSIFGLLKNIGFAFIMLLIAFYFVFFWNIMGLTVVISFVLVLFFIFSFISYTNASIFYPTVKKYIIEPADED